jgi:hypothetical protein
VSWSPAGPGLILMCFTDTARKGDLLFPSPSCFPVPANGTPVVISEAPGEQSLLRANVSQ